MDNKKFDIGTIISHKGNTILGLLFINDNIVFYKANLKLCKILRDSFQNFCTRSGQLINFHPSSFIFFKGLSNQIKSNISRLFNMHTKNYLGKYAGIYFGTNKSSSANLLSLR